ncbi:MAG: type II toxin-antitoxin system HicB family antitoxin, partial [Oscillibacter sp.]|nr:type II toxin-antitoxin system HicB family antitoxin [Oscillibacter sp.]
MKKTDRYMYPAVFTYYGPGKEIAVVFPDLNCATSGVDDEDALLSARELLGLTILGMEEDGEEIPA